MTPCQRHLGGLPWLVLGLAGGGVVATALIPFWPVLWAKRMGWLR